MTTQTIGGSTPATEFSDKCRYGRLDARIFCEELLDRQVTLRPDARRPRP